MQPIDGAPVAPRPLWRGPPGRVLTRAGSVAFIVLLGAVPIGPAPQPVASGQTPQQARTLDNPSITALCIASPDEARTSAALQRFKSRRAQAIEQRRRRARLAGGPLEETR